MALPAKPLLSGDLKRHVDFAKGLRLEVPVVVRENDLKPATAFVQKLQLRYRRKLARRIMNVKPITSQDIQAYREYKSNNTHEEKAMRVFMQFTRQREYARVLQVDQKKIDSVVEEVRENNINGALQIPHAARIALAALHHGQMNETEVSTLLEAEQFQRVNGCAAYQCLPLFSDQKFTIEGKRIVQQMLKEMKGDSFHSGAILAKFEIALRSKSNVYHLFHRVKVKNTFDEISANTKEWYSFSKHEFVLPHPTLIDTFDILSFGAQNVLGKILFGEDWVLLKYRLGGITNEQIDVAQRRNVRLASTSTSDAQIRLLMTHGKATRQDGITLHDGIHRLSSAGIPAKVRSAFNYMIDLVRRETKLVWTYELARLVDRPNLDGDKGSDFKVHPEKAFFQYLLNALLFLELDDASNVISKLDVSRLDVFMGIIASDMLKNAKQWKTQFNIDITKLPEPFASKIAQAKQSQLLQPAANQLKFKFAKDKENILTVIPETEDKITIAPKPNF